MEEHNIFKVMKGENVQTKALYPTRISFRSYEKIKSFTDNVKQVLGQDIFQNQFSMKCNYNAWSKGMNVQNHTVLVICSTQTISLYKPEQA